MKYEIDCQVIRDLLPLYEDNAASEETQALVQAHLKDCPDCREELRKMHTPISVPPEDDKDVVKRLRELRAQARRKQKVRTICVVSVLVLIAVFCLWYTWPRSWTRVAGTDPVDGLNAILTTHRINSGWDAWGLDEEDADADVTDNLLRVLNGHTYRSSLSNLLNGTPFRRHGHTVSGSTGYVSFFLYIQDHQECISFSLWSNGDMVYSTSGPSTDSFLYRTDPALYEELAEIVREYGKLED